MIRPRCFLLAVLAALPGLAQDSVRPRDVRDAAESGPSSIPRMAEYLEHPDVNVRVEAVKQLIEFGSVSEVLDPLLRATADNDPEVQARATDALVNFYLPGYVSAGFAATLRRVGGTVKGRFTDTNDQVIDPYVRVRPEVIAALGKLVRGGGTMEARANAARALGILRAQPALDDLIEALRSKDSTLIYESLVALQKIRDRSAAPRIAFLLRDFDQKVQIAAIETSGLLQNGEALPGLTDVLTRTRDAKVRRAALTAIAMLPDPANRDLYRRYLHDRDEQLRAGAAEGYGRLKNAADVAMLQKAWDEEKKSQPRLSLGFALVMLGRHEMIEFSPLQYLVNTLNSTAYRGVAFAFLVELAREKAVRMQLYQPMLAGTKDEKIWLAQVMSRSGDPEALPYLEKLSRDGDAQVAQEGLRALRTLQARH